MYYHLKDKITNDGEIFRSKSALMKYIDFVCKAILVPFNRTKDDFEVTKCTKNKQKKIEL